MAGPWIKLDADFWHNGKVAKAGNSAVGVYVRALTYCGDQLTDGFIPRHVARLIGTPADLRRLTSTGLWHEVAEGEWLTEGFAAPDDGYYVPDYLEHQSSRAEVQARHEERSRSGKKGAEKRWQQP